MPPDQKNLLIPGPFQYPNLAISAEPVFRTARRTGVFQEAIATINLLKPLSRSAILIRRPEQA
jgi:hypothetical protein